MIGNGNIISCGWIGKKSKANKEKRVVFSQTTALFYAYTEVTVTFENVPDNAPSDYQTSANPKSLTKVTVTFTKFQSLSTV